METATILSIFISGLLLGITGYLFIQLLAQYQKTLEIRLKNMKIKYKQ